MDRRDQARPGNHARRVQPAVRNPHVEDAEEDDENPVEDEVEFEVSEVDYRFPSLQC